MQNGRAKQPLTAGMRVCVRLFHHHYRRADRDASAAPLERADVSSHLRAILTVYSGVPGAKRLASTLSHGKVVEP